MALRDVFKVSRKTFLDPSAWIGLDSLRANNQTITDSLSGLMKVPEPGRKESFQQAVERLGVSDQDMQTTLARYRLFSYLFLTAGLLLIFFGFYLLFRHGTFSGLLLALVSSSLFLAQAFRYDFWHFQIVQRKLGCTFDEWWNGKINDGGAQS